MKPENMWDAFKLLPDAEKAAIDAKMAGDEGEMWNKVNDAFYGAMAPLAGSIPPWVMHQALQSAIGRLIAAMAGRSEDADDAIRNDPEFLTISVFIHRMVRQASNPGVALMVLSSVSGAIWVGIQREHEAGLQAEAAEAASRGVKPS